MADHDGSMITDVDHERELAQERADGEKMREALWDIGRLHQYEVAGTVGRQERCQECHRPWPCQTATIVGRLRRAPATPGGV